MWFHCFLNVLNSSTNKCIVLISIIVLFLICLAFRPQTSQVFLSFFVCTGIQFTHCQFTGFYKQWFWRNRMIEWMNKWKTGNTSRYRSSCIGTYHSVFPDYTVYQSTGRLTSTNWLTSWLIDQIIEADNIGQSLPLYITRRNRLMYSKSLLSAQHARSSQTILISYGALCMVFTALQRMPSRTSYEKGVCRLLFVCSSVCQTRDLWQNKRELCPNYYTAWKIIYPSFVTRRMVGEILGQTDPVGAKSTIFSSASVVAPSKKI